MELEFMNISTLIHSSECLTTIISLPIDIGCSLEYHSITIRLTNTDGFD